MIVFCAFQEFFKDPMKCIGMLLDFSLRASSTGSQRHAWITSIGVSENLS
jgi:hypothetical protein